MSLRLALLMSLCVTVSPACGPESDPSSTDVDPDGGADSTNVVDPVSLVFVGDSVGRGTLVGEVYSCVLRFDALVGGGGPEGSLVWKSASITFEELGESAAVRSRSGWNQAFVMRFFGLQDAVVESPAELEGGPLTFGASDGRPFDLDLAFAYERSYPEGDTVASWRFSCL